MNINYRIWKELLEKLRETKEIEVSSVDIKEYLYCPRLIYFTRVLNLKMPYTDRMWYGKEIQDELRKFEERRKTVLTKLKLKGFKIFNKVFRVKEFGLVASVDYILNTQDIPIPIELKVYETESLYNSHEYQVIFQALTIEFSINKTIPECYVYYVESDKFFKIKLNDDKKIHVIKLILKIRNLIKTNELPEVERVKKCRYCQFRNICPSS